jgi:hypothetical protein
VSTPAALGFPWFPLVPRSRPPGVPLAERVRELRDLAARLDDGTRQDQATRAAEVFNKAALTASDCGAADLARDLCRRQREVYAAAAPVPAWAARIAMQPIVNVPRQLIREDHGDDAYKMLQALHHAALRQATADVDGTRIDFAKLTGTADGHKEIRRQTWTALLADGARALAQAGRWQEAAESTARYKGTGNRLLDGRQMTIAALLEQGRTSEAITMIDSSVFAEPWEHTVAALLRIRCTQNDAPAPHAELTRTAEETLALVTRPEPTTAVFRSRLAMTALHLSTGWPAAPAALLRAAAIGIAQSDACAARDVLAHNPIRRQMTRQQEQQLDDVRVTGGLGIGALPPACMDMLSHAVYQARGHLLSILRSAGG